MSNQRVEIDTINVENLDEDESGIIVVSIFGNKEVGICVSKKNGGDVEIWLNKSQVIKLSLACQKALEELDG